MPFTITLSSDYAYVSGVFFSVVSLLIWQTITVNNLRVKAGIQYPQLYADKEEMANSKDAMKFNCAQRAHQNTLENVTPIAICTTIVATIHPLLAAVALAGWTLSRVAYTRGYLTGIPNNRNNLATRVFFVPAYFALHGGAIYTMYEMFAT
ncbi:hypothetical protein C8F01DRAFT_1253802 [Mycena amicta]|nr:hypothetical protein C8F01DRAFT_1253802 [Mycena amicta]